MSERPRATFTLVEKPTREAPPQPSPWRAIGYGAIAGIASTAWLWGTLLVEQPALREDEFMRAFLPILLGITLAVEVLGAMLLGFVVWVVSKRSALGAKVFVLVLNVGNVLHGLTYAASISPLALVAAVLAGIGLWLVARAHLAGPSNH